MNAETVLTGGTGGKGVATDLSLLASYSTNSLLVFMDTALLERVQATRRALGSVLIFVFFEALGNLLWIWQFSVLPAGLGVRGLDYGTAPSS